MHVSFVSNGPHPLSTPNPTPSDQTAPKLSRHGESLPNEPIKIEREAAFDMSEDALWPETRVNFSSYAQGPRARAFSGSGLRFCARSITPLRIAKFYPGA